MTTTATSTSKEKGAGAAIAPSAISVAIKDALTTALLVIGLGTPIVLIDTHQSGAGITLEWRFGWLAAL